MLDKGLLKAVIEEIEKEIEENDNLPPWPWYDDGWYDSWYAAGLQKIKQLLEDSIK